MTPRTSVRRWTLSRCSQPPRAGFTLVELLVVIAIIAMLAGLVTTGVMTAKEAGRKATCMNNQQQLGKAIINMATLKDKFPAGIVPQPMSNNLFAGWVPQLLPNLEQQPLFDLYQKNMLMMRPSLKLTVLTCPSSDVKDYAAPLSYVVNMGMHDQMPQQGGQLDWPENGLFFDQFTSMMMGNGPGPSTDLTFVSKHDGVSMTIMISENVDTRDWYVTQDPMSGSPAMTSPPCMADSSTTLSCWWQGMVWFPFDPMPYMADSDITGPLPCNQGQGMSGGAGMNLPGGNDFFARPSSRHPNGFYITLADGRTLFMNSDVYYRVYASLMSPDTAKARQPGMPPGNMIVYPSNWYMPGTNMPMPLTDADIQK